jgi:alanine or glycine:cation symporter, AGCS family
MLALKTVWEFAGISMGFMAMVNLTTLVLLSGWALGALADYDRDVAAGKPTRFRLSGNPLLPSGLTSDAWP